MIKDPHFPFVVVGGQRAAVSLWPPLKEALSTSFFNFAYASIDGTRFSHRKHLCERRGLSFHPWTH